jgi:hypothetical protein
MALWKVTPVWKKSVVETQIWVKEGVAGYISHEIGWRGGEFFIESEEEPDIDDDTNLLELSDDWSTDDGNWEETSYDLAEESIEDETREFLEENSVFDLEEQGWTMEECSIVIQGGMNIEKVID